MAPSSMIPLLLPILVVLLSLESLSAQQNIRTFFPSIPSPAFLSPPPPAPPPPTPPSPSPASAPPSSSSSSSRHDVTVAVVSTAFSSFALSAIFFFLFLRFTSKSQSTAVPHSAPDHKANQRLQPLPQEKFNHDIVDESGLDAIYWREFEKENGYRPPSDRKSGRSQGSSPQSLSRPPSAEGRPNATASDGEEERDKKHSSWLRRKKKDREPLIPPGSLDSSSSFFYDSVGSSTSFDTFPPQQQTAGYDMSPVLPHSVSEEEEELVKEVHTVATSGARPGNAQLRPPPGQRSPSRKPPRHPTASLLSPPTLLQPQLPLPPSRLSSSSKPPVESVDYSSGHLPQSNPFLPLPPGRQSNAGTPPQEPLITIESIPAPDSSPPHELAGPLPVKFTTVPAPPPRAPPPPSGGPPPPPPPRGRGGPPPPPPPGGRGGAPPPPPPGGRGGPPPPPPPGGRGRGGPSPPPPPGGRGRGGPPGPPSLRPPASPGHPSGPTGPRMKPLHWEVMRKLNPGQSMVWDRFKEGGSFRFDEESMEALFGATVAPSRLKPTEETDSNTSAATPSALPQIILLEPRKSQNIAIVLRSLSCTRQDILDVLLEGHGDVSIDALEKLSKLGLAKEEQDLIRGFDGDPSRLADAESFLFVLLRSVPNAFERVDAMLFRATYGQEVANVEQSLQVLEHACKELRGSALFFKLLEVVLKAGNRMNAGTARGNAQAFNLASLHKLSDVKATDGSITLLHFIVEEVVRTEGKRSAINSSFGLRRTSSITSNASGRSGEDSSAAAAAREERHLEYMQLGLPVVSRISAEMASVKRAAGIDYDTLVAVCPSLQGRLSKIKRLLNSSVGDPFATEIQGFVDGAEQEISSVRIEQERVLELVKRTTEYYHAGASKDKSAAPLQLFVIIKDFLAMVDKVCVDITKKQQQQQQQRQKKLVAVGGTSAEGGGGSRSGRKDNLDSSVKKDSAERSGRRGEGTDGDADVDGDGRRIMPRFPNLPPNFMSENHESDSSSDED